MRRSYAMKLSGEQKYKIAFYVMLGIVAAVLLFVLFGWLVQFLWNATIASIFSLNDISFWQAIGLLILAKILFGFGGSSSAGRYSRRRKHKGNNKDCDKDNDFSGSEFNAFWAAEGKAAFAAYRSQTPDENKG